MKLCLCSTGDGFIERYTPFPYDTTSVNVSNFLSLHGAVMVPYVIHASLSLRHHSAFLVPRTEQFSLPEEDVSLVRGVAIGGIGRTEGHLPQSNNEEIYKNGNNLKR